MNINEMTIGQIATLDNDLQAVIVDINKGWVKLDTGKSVRATSIKDVEDIEHDTEDDEDEVYSMANHINKYRSTYETTRNWKGNKTKVTGDDLSHRLLALTPDEVVELASNLLDRDDLHAKYFKLNPGQRRMNAGNLIRNAMKREDLTFEEVVDAIAHGWHVLADRRKQA